MTPPIAQLADVAFHYPGASRDALAGETWDIAPGSLAVVIGASGSGKSTLLRCLNGLVPHFSGGAFGGRVTIDGIDTRGAGPRELSHLVGFVFQDPETQMITDRVDDELAFAMEQLGVDRPTMRRRVDWALERTGIAHLADRRPGELSGGERQRVAIAAALATQPRLFVLDEPTSQLDPAGAAAIVDGVTELARDNDMAIVIAEHRLDHLLGVASELKVMAGKAMCGDPAIVAARMDPTPLPQVTRLARALTLDMLPLEVESARTAFAGVALPPAPPPSPEPGGEILTLLSGITVERGQLRPLDGVDLRVRVGELVAVMGRNGSGKTTLLRTIAALQSASSGEVHTMGRDMRQTHPAELAGRVGYVPQQASTLFHRERLIDELRSTGRAMMPGSDPIRTLERFGLAAMATRHPLDLSGGERERAAMAIVLHGQPNLLLLDEPTRGMDAWRKRDLATLLDDVRRDGAGIVMATHDVELVARCATRVVILENGLVIADGHPRNVLPASNGLTTQINVLFGETWLTVEDVLGAIGNGNSVACANQVGAAGVR